MKLNVFKIVGKSLEKADVEVKETFSMMGHEFFLHRPVGNDKGWKVSEYSSGYGVCGIQDSRNIAVITAKANILKMGEDLSDVIGNAVKETGIINS